MGGSLVGWLVLEVAGWLQCEAGNQLSIIGCVQFNIMCKVEVHQPLLMEFESDTKLGERGGSGRA